MPNPVDTDGQFDQNGAEDRDTPASAEAPRGETSSSSAAQADAPERPHRRPKGVGASVIKIVGGALAAMTAAAIGSGLGVAGTVGGAALVSACVAILDSAYTSSLQRTHQGVRKLVRTAGPALPKGRPGRAVSGHPEPAGTAAAAAGPGPQRGIRTWSKRKRVLTATLAAAGVVFVVSLGGIVTVELISGKSFSGKTGTTTVSQAVRGHWTHSRTGGDRGHSDRPGGQQSDGDSNQDRYGNQGQDDQGRGSQGQDSQGQDNQGQDNQGQDNQGQDQQGQDQQHGTGNSQGPDQNPQPRGNPGNTYGGPGPNDPQRGPTQHPGDGQQNPGRQHDSQGSDRQHPGNGASSQAPDNHQQPNPQNRSSQQENSGQQGAGNDGSHQDQHTNEQQNGSDSHSDQQSNGQQNQTQHSSGDQQPKPQSSGG